ncbi:MAG: tetraacyldisaccharide 4'-kinase [Candidatus Deianiraeaceae bacterium]|jgi:tetraacyldisaccharide 4'-kinase
MFKTPLFLNNRYSLVSITLIPLSWIFTILTTVRQNFSKKITVKDKKIICIGNATVGGTGKTPIAIAIAIDLKKCDKSVCFISRGYRRKSKGFVTVNTDDASHTGDEPQLLKQYAQTYLYSSIKDILNNIHKIKEDIIIMDDGLQNSIHKDFTALVIGRNGFGNERIMPAGPLRESKHKALLKSHCVLMYTTHNIVHRHIFKIKHHYTHNINPQLVIAFSGLGDNQKFLHSLENLGFKVEKFYDFPDHHPYKVKDIVKIINYAKKLDLKIITTEKDFVKIPLLYRKSISTLNIKVHLDERFIEMVRNAIYTA